MALGEKRRHPDVKGYHIYSLLDGISNFDLGDPWSNRITKEFE